MAKLSLTKLERHLYGAADILRREGMDAATYKDFIFGMLFLKRCSDVFDSSFEDIVAEKARTKRLDLVEAKARYGENPDFYDEFFVPEHARWEYLLSKLNDATESYGAVLDRALQGLAESNMSLQHVLDHIHFMRMQSNKRIVSDEACRDLVRHFNRYRLRNEDFQFSDLLGSAYEFLINMFAEAAGKKGGDFYTPRDVIRLMVRILDPQPKMKIYDPTCGSGGMLIISREYIEQSGGNPQNLRLCGQVNDASAWSICKINMLLHGIYAADIKLQDTLLHPMHREGGELEHFHRVIANPPFSQNYTRNNMEYPERFRWGWCPTSGKKADLMFAQHMLSLCKPGGMVATVMPHGVLFRGGVEKEIRTKFLEQDLIEAIISLPPNLFYGAPIPACILVMRSNLSGQRLNPHKPENRRGKVLFINADAEYQAGRAQNYLRPEDIEKICSTYERCADFPGYSRAVDIEEIAAETNDFNLNVRRYVDNSPPPEPQDVRAHLTGGIPWAEVTGQKPLFDSLGLSPEAIFTPKADDPRYCAFAPEIAERSAIVPRIENDTGVQERTQALRTKLNEWWSSQAQNFIGLPRERNLNAVRSRFLQEFTQALLPFGVLGSFKLSGIVATWWANTLPDLKTLMENGFGAVVDGWIDAIADALEDEDNSGPAFDPFSHKLVKETMADYLQRIEEAKTEIVRLKGDKEAFEQSNPPEDAEDEELTSWNYAKDLETKIKSLKAEIKERRLPVKDLNKALKAQQKRKKDAEKIIKQLTGKGQKSIAQAEKKGHPTEALHAELWKQRGIVDEASAEFARIEGQIQDIETAVQPLQDEIDSLQELLAPYEQIKADLAAVRATYRSLIKDFLDELSRRCEDMTVDYKQELVLKLFAQDLHAGLDEAVRDRQQELVRFVENLWDKYRVSLFELRHSQEIIKDNLDNILDKLGYV